MSSVYEQILTEEISEGDDEEITISFVLDEKEQVIRFVPKHFHALQTCVKYLDSVKEKQ